MYCKICKEKTEKIFRAKILNKFEIDYYFCSVCEFLQTENPYWLEEAYETPVNLTDTGLLSRNIELCKRTAVLLFFLFDKDAKYVDHAGGYGILTRLMRDTGFDFFWSDPYTQNLFARGFEFSRKIENVKLITSFESFEHFVDPMREVEEMLKISDNVFFTTELMPRSVPSSENWWYYGLGHGQHISFYSLTALRTIAQKLGLNLCSNKKNLHLLTREKINSSLFNLLLKSSYGIFWFVKWNMKSKTNTDSEKLIIDGKDN